MNNVKRCILGLSICALGATFSLPAYAASADLAARGTGTSDPTIIPIGYTFNATLTNNGPDTATGVKAMLNVMYGQGLPPSIAISQGTCTRYADPYVVCDIGVLPRGTTVNITASWISGSNSLGIQLQGNETDPNMANNNVTITAVSTGTGGKQKPPKK